MWGSLVVGVGKCVGVPWSNRRVCAAEDLRQQYHDFRRYARPYSCQKRYRQAETSVFSCFVYNKASAVARVSLSTSALAYYVPDTSADLQGDSIRLDFGNFQKEPCKFRIGSMTASSNASRS